MNDYIHIFLQKFRDALKILLRTVCTRQTELSVITLFDQSTCDRALSTRSNFSPSQLVHEVVQITQIV